MKNNSRRLRAISKMIDLNAFYAITVYPGSLFMQGYFNRELVDKLKKHKFTGWKIGDDPSYVHGHRGNIEITLT